MSSHQGGQYFVKHPAGRAMYEFFGKTYLNQICNADVDLGDLLYMRSCNRSSYAEGI